MIFGLSISFFISQILAGIAVIGDILSFQYKERKQIIFFFIVSATCIALHYFLLGRYAAGVLVSLGLIRFLTSYHTQNKKIMGLFLVLFACVFYILRKDWYDIIMLLGVSFITFAVFYKNDYGLRIFMMLGTSCVLAYNFLVFSPVGVILELIFLGSNLLGFYKYYIKKGSKLL